MIFHIDAFDKKSGLYRVISNANEQMMVSSYQIVNVMIQGYMFNNARLTSKGFAFTVCNKTKYVQLNNMTKEMMIAMHNRLEYIKAQNENIKQQEEIARKQEELRQKEEIKNQQQMRQQQQQAKTKINSQKSKNIQIEQANTQPSNESKHIIANNRNTKIIGHNTKRITYKGDSFLNEEQLCKKYGADVNKFKKLRAKGYTIAESLGEKPLRPENMITSPDKMQKILDSMARQRGEY